MAKPIDDEAHDQNRDRRDSRGKDCVVRAVARDRFADGVDKGLDLIHFLFL